MKYHGSWILYYHHHHHHHLTLLLFIYSPAVVANLWDVTDKSIDQLTGKMFNTWGLLKNNTGNNNNNVSLVEAVASSRDACTLPYLIGAAPIVYGIPVYIKRS